MIGDGMSLESAGNFLTGGPHPRAGGGRSRM
jgi:hypothetical protein